jgi:molybdopterin/thiamine biosynthesis adenylyltransferase
VRAEPVTNERGIRIAAKEIGNVTMTREREMLQTDTAGDRVWRPIIFDPAVPDDARELAFLRDSDRVWRTTDTLEQQLHDLAETRLRGKSPSAAELAICEREISGGAALAEFGRWVLYPWSGRLVHLLPPAEFRELRLDRNRHKVTREEQATLDGLTIGIVGLSVGNAIATTLALEGTCGHLRLADFDHLALSNLNRIRAGVEDIGLPKAVLAARQIFEQDPYVDLSLWQEGLAPASIDEFLDGPPPVDVLVEECDDLRLKVLVREAARARRLPVLMATSDRGMIDVERFDREPARPLFHGLVGDLAAADVPEQPDTEEKVKIVTGILGLDTLSPRIGASMLEIGETITTWPQLGSDVALGGATITAAVRRLALGQTLPSGRRYLDMEQALTANVTTIATNGHTEPATTDREPLDARIPDFVRFAVAHGVLAPSAGNCQPWRFGWDGERLWITHDLARSANLMDSERRTGFVALGAAVENIKIAAAHQGFATTITPFPCHNPTIVAALMFTQDEAAVSSAAARLLPAVVARATNRRVGTRVPLDRGTLDALAESVEGFGVHVDLVTDHVSLAEAGRIAGTADRVRFFHPDFHAELVSELRWSPEAAAATRDGIDLATLELSAAAAAAMRLVARADVVAFLRTLRDGGHALEELAGKAMRASSAVALLTSDGDRPADLLRAGQGVERFWLAATELGVAVQPWTTATYLVDLLKTEQAALFAPSEQAAVCDLGTRLDRLFPRSAGRPRLMLSRLFVAEAPSARALRLPLERVLTYGQPAARATSMAITTKETSR